ncbi:MAG: hypothetical protein ACKOE7_02555, partial [Actinomycetota bacterium]
MLANWMPDHIERGARANRLASDTFLVLPRSHLGREEIVARLLVASGADDAVFVAVVDDRRTTQQI